MSASLSLLTNIIAIAIHKNGGEPLKLRREDELAIAGKEVVIQQVIGGDCDLLVELRDKAAPEGEAS